MAASRFTINDAAIRTALRQALCAEHAAEPDTVIVEELGLGHGAARIDMAVINTELRGFEIKSDRDSLDRLPDQAMIYGGALDRVTLVVGYRHAGRAFQMVPVWWGVRLAVPSANGGVELVAARDAQPNPAVDAVSVAELLWRDEALALLEEVGAADGVRSKPRAVLYARIARTVGLDRVRSRAREQLRRRRGSRSDGRRRSSDG